MIVFIDRLERPQALVTIIVTLLVTISVAAAHLLLTRRSLPRNAPKFWNLDHWPVLGAWRFYSHRYDMFRDAQRSTKTGNFSFYVGKKLVVGLSGLAGRKAFYETRELNLSEGFSDMLLGMPSTSTGSDAYQLFMRSLTYLVKRERLAENLAILTTDTRALCARLSDGSVSQVEPTWRVMNSFDTIMKHIFQLTMRTVGAQEVAEDLELLGKTMSTYMQFNEMSSSIKIFLPWMPTPGYLLRLYNGARLYRVFQSIIDKRKLSGKRLNDPLQFLLDRGEDMRSIIGFEIGVLFTAFINSGVVTTYLLILLAENPEWKTRVRNEVDAVVTKYRATQDQTAAEVLNTLTLEQWESEFKIVRNCVYETIRYTQRGTTFRKNTSKKDIPIGKTGEVIPAGSYATFLQDDVHQNVEFFPDPLSFDPGRFMEERTQNNNQSNAFLGWGTGLHPCPGMRFATLEITITNVHMIATFDYEVAEKDGRSRSSPIPTIDRNTHQTFMPKTPIYLRYKLR